MSAARKILLPAFTLTETCSADAAGAIRREIPAVDGKPETYYFRPVERPITYQESGPNFCYNTMPVVLNSDNSPWTDGNLCLLSKLQGVLNPNMASYYCMASDLGALKRFFDLEHIDYLHFPSRKLLRPTYRYNGFLKQRAMAGEISLHMAKRRMGAAIGFYRWLIEEKNFAPSNPLWVQSDVYIGIKDSRGFPKTIKEKTTDVSIKYPIRNDPYAETIDDGEKLRPLPANEQDALLDALIKLGNTEMTLIHLLALHTGARIQTVLTMQVRHVSEELSPNIVEHRLSVGSGTGIDTKFDTSMTLHIPAWLYEKLRIYAFSDRAKRRRIKAGGDYETQYLFISSHGLPFYESKASNEKFSESFDRRHKKCGQGVRTYIREFILPLMRRSLGNKYQYRFHDLRASYGMNLTDLLLPLVPMKMTLHNVREFVKTRMGHKHASVTDRYLNYRAHQKLVAAAQLEYELHLENLKKKAMNIHV